MTLLKFKLTVSLCYLNSYASTWLSFNSTWLSLFNLTFSLFYLTFKFITFEFNFLLNFTLKPFQIFFCITFHLWHSNKWLWTFNIFFLISSFYIKVHNFNKRQKIIFYGTATSINFWRGWWWSRCAMTQFSLTLVYIFADLDMPRWIIKSSFFRKKSNFICFKDF